MIDFCLPNGAVDLVPRGATSFRGDLQSIRDARGQSCAGGRALGVGHRGLDVFTTIAV